jgi:transcriptional regulator
MYIPRHYQEQDSEELYAFMERFGFATLVTTDGGVPFATHVPLQLERHSGQGVRLTGHMARANPQWQGFSQASEALAIFHGPHAYISPTWYVTQPQVPTWNYAVVHAYGAPHLIEEPSEVMRILREASARYEAGSAAPWTPVQAEDYVHKRLSGIVAFELRITRLEGKFKLNQKHSAQDRHRIIEALERSTASEDQQVAELMRRREPSTDPKAHR